MTNIRVGGRTSEERIAERLKELARTPPPENGSSPPHAMDTSPMGFSIRDLPDRYRLQNIVCDGTLCVVDWSKKLLDRGRSHTQVEWAQRTADEEFHVPPGPVYGATMCALYDNREADNQEQRGLVGLVRTMLSEDFAKKKTYVMTSTRVVRDPTGQDEVYHRFGYRDVSRRAWELVGPGGFIGPGFEDFTEAILGTRDVAKIKHASHWITGKNPYAWRFNQQLERRGERVLLLGCSDDKFDINSIADVLDYWSARGVVVRAGASSGAGGS